MLHHASSHRPRPPFGAAFRVDAVRLLAASALAGPATAPAADPQSDALTLAIDACLSTTLSFDKKLRALTGFVDAPMQPEDFEHHGWANSLPYPVPDQLPYPTAGPDLMALLPVYESYVQIYVEDYRWMVQRGMITMWHHPTGWTLTVERDELDPLGGYCTLWHDVPTEETRASLDALTGCFAPYPVPFAHIADLAAWRTQGTHDFDQSLTIVYPNQSQLPNAAEVYVLMDLFAYDLTEEY